MPDLTIEYYHSCISNHYWSTSVIGKSGTYTVLWDNFSHKNQKKVQFDFSCNCPNYQFNKHHYCKHILAVKDSRCNWDEFIDGGEVKDGKCPKCGRETMVTRVGV